jgi:hypothetical protein
MEKLGVVSRNHRIFEELWHPFSLLAEAFPEENEIPENRRFCLDFLRICGII